METSTDPTDTLTAKVQENGALAIRDARTQLLSKAEQEQRRRLKQAQRTYGRGKQINVKGIKDKKLRRKLGHLETKFEDAALKAKDAEILLESSNGFLEPEGELERTDQVRQDEIVRNAPIETAQKRFDLKLDQLGPYLCEYTPNGRHLLLAGKRGHVATFDWRSGKLGCELQMRETIRDIRWLHNSQYFSVAQKREVYIYDHNGVQLHCLRKHLDVAHLEFLRYHFLLCTLSRNGQLKYMDTSTGQLVSELQTIKSGGQPVSLTANPYNAVLHLGHQNGIISLWSPNSSDPLVKLLAHRGPVRSLAVDRQGRYMVTAGQDNKMAVWDIRMFKQVNSYHTRSPASSISISDTGLTAIACGSLTTIWRGLYSKDAAVQERVESPYMKWGSGGSNIERVRFCPLEDVLGVSHNGGFSSILVPGAGEANFDALEVNPFETVKQRQEGEVKALLNKLKPEMIALDPNYIGNLDLRSEKQRQADKDLDAAPVDIATEIRNKARGKNGALKKFLRKQRRKNVIDEKRLKVDEIWKEQQQQRDQKFNEEKREELGPALARFARKP